MIGRLRDRLRLADLVWLRVFWLVRGRAPNRRRSPDVLPPRRALPLACDSVRWSGDYVARASGLSPVWFQCRCLIEAVPRTDAGRPTAAAAPDLSGLGFRLPAQD